MERIKQWKTRNPKIVSIATGKDTDFFEIMTSTNGSVVYVGKKPMILKLLN